VDVPVDPIPVESDDAADNPIGSFIFVSNGGKSVDVPVDPIPVESDDAADNPIGSFIFVSNGDESADDSLGAVPGGAGNQSSESAAPFVMSSTEYRGGDGVASVGPFVVSSTENAGHETLATIGHELDEGSAGGGLPPADDFPMAEDDDAFFTVLNVSGDQVLALNVSNDSTSFPLASSKLITPLNVSNDGQLPINMSGPFANPVARADPGGDARPVAGKGSNAEKARLAEERRRAEKARLVQKRRHEAAVAEYTRQRRAICEGEQARLRGQFERARRDARGRAENAARDDAARQITRFKSENKQYFGVHPKDTPDIARALGRLRAIEEAFARARRDRAAIPGVDDLNTETGRLRAERAVVQRECREGEAAVNEQKEAVRRMYQDVVVAKATAAKLEANLMLLAEASQLLISHSAAVATALTAIVRRMRMPLTGQGAKSCRAMIMAPTRLPPAFYQETVDWLHNIVSAYQG
jgi:hypothetical protein